MRMRPQRGMAHPDAVRQPQELRGPDEPQFIGSRAIAPFLASGGAAAFLNGGEGFDFDPSREGCQLVCAHYVPQGQVGFVKELMVTPLCPPILGEPSVPDAWATYTVLGTLGTARGSERAGYYRTPLGWTVACAPTEGPAIIPSWHWQLYLMAGNPIASRPPFVLTDPSTWFLQLNVAVPLTAYPQGFPGSPVWPLQTVQVTPEQIFETHLLVPPDTTVALFVRWRQQPFRPTWLVREPITDPEVLITADSFVLPILPSVGRLHGYQQASQSESSVENAQYGW